MNVNSIGEYIRQQREQAKISLRQLAQAAGVSNPYLSQVERGLRKPSAEILQQIAKGLRISAEALYVQAGILEDKPADSGVRSALLADPGLSERQKQVLIEIYESFRRENGDAHGPGQETGDAEDTAAGYRADDVAAAAATQAYAAGESDGADAAGETAAAGTSGRGPRPADPLPGTGATSAWAAATDDVAEAAESAEKPDAAGGAAQTG